MFTDAPRLSVEERGAMLAIWDGYYPHQFVTVPLHFLHLHMPEQFYKPALRYLQLNKITGKKFVELMKELETPLALQHWLTERVTREKHLNLIAGKTFK